MRPDSDTIKKFRYMVKRHYRILGRDLPWRRTKNPYRIAVSEIMLQQTHIARVLHYYPRFLRQFPNFQTLATAPLSKILAAWQGLGYNRRAIFLKKIARRVCDQHHGMLPSDPEILMEFPGIGTNTAGAISAFAFNRPALFIETNIRRAFIYFFFPRRRKINDKEIMPLIEETLDRKNPREWYYALMDYGAMLGVVQKGKMNPNRRSRHYVRQSKFAGSDRQLRGKIIALMLDQKKMSEKILIGKLAVSAVRTKKIIASLIAERLLNDRKGILSIAS